MRAMNSTEDSTREVESDDAQLLRRYTVESDAAAIDCLITRHMDMAFRMARGYLENSDDAEDAVMNRQLAARIDRAVDTLPADQREVFLMREVMDLPFAEIARAVGASEPTVKSRMRYALEKLRAALEGFREVPSASGPSGGEIR